MGSTCMSFYAIVFEIQENMFKTSINARPLSFNVFFLENPSEYPHKPYIARNCQKLSLLKISAAECMCLSLLIFT